MSTSFPNAASRPEETTRRFSPSRERTEMWKLAGVSDACACSFSDLATAGSPCCEASPCYTPADSERTGRNIKIGPTQALFDGYWSLRVPASHEGK
jgi:hypothetical protein